MKLIKKIEYTYTFLFQEDSKIIKFIESKAISKPIIDKPFAKINLFNQAGGKLNNYMENLVGKKPSNKLDDENNFKDLNFNITFNINPGIKS